MRRFFPRWLFGLAPAALVFSLGPLPPPVVCIFAFVIGVIALGVTGRVRNVRARKAVASALSRADPRLSSPAPHEWGLRRVRLK